MIRREKKKKMSAVQDSTGYGMLICWIVFKCKIMSGTKKQELIKLKNIGQHCKEKNQRKQWKWEHVVKVSQTMTKQINLNPKIGVLLHD